MAPLQLHHLRPLAAVPIASLLLLAGLAGAADTRGKKVGVTMRYADPEEARWLDRYAETHEPLGAGGPLTMRRATDEEARWLNRISDTTGRARESRGGGEDSGSGSGDDAGYLEFDQDNPYVEALRNWVSRWTNLNLNGDPDSQDKPRVEDGMQDL